MMGAKSEETKDITVISVLIEGPAVSLNGSPTVSPTTAALCASEPGPPNLPDSMYFFALSQSPPAFAMKSAKITPVKIAPPRNRPKHPGQARKPTSSGKPTAKKVGKTNEEAHLAQLNLHSDRNSGVSVPLKYLAFPGTAGESLRSYRRRYGLRKHQQRAKNWRGSGTQQHTCNHQGLP